MENLKKVCDQWGSFVHLDKETASCENFCSAKILLETYCFQFIQGSLVMLVNGSTYDIFVKEVGFGESKCKCNAGYVENEVSKSCEENAIPTIKVGNIQVMGEKENSHGFGTFNALIDFNTHNHLVGNNSLVENVLEPEQNMAPISNKQNKIDTGLHLIVCGPSGTEMSHTKSLDDDRLTIEVLCNLGLEQK